MTTPTTEAQRAILENSIQQATNTAFAASSLAKAFVEAGLTEEGKAKAEEASKYERVSLALTKQLETLNTIVSAA
jgi:hypothetical protein